MVGRDPEVKEWPQVTWSSSPEVLKVIDIPLQGFLRVLCQDPGQLKFLKRLHIATKLERLFRPQRTE